MHSPKQQRVSDALAALDFAAFFFMVGADSKGANRFKIMSLITVGCCRKTAPMTARSPAPVPAPAPAPIVLARSYPVAEETNVDYVVSMPQCSWCNSPFKTEDRFCRLVNFEVQPYG